MLGHESCGAVDATIKSLKDDNRVPGHMPSLVTALTPAVKAVLGKGGDVLGSAIRQNVIDNVAKLKSATPILSAAVAQGKAQDRRRYLSAQGWPVRYDPVTTLD